MQLVQTHILIQFRTIEKIKRRDNKICKQL